MDGKMAARWRWELYTLCTMDALFIPLIGEGLEGTVKASILVFLYIVWAVLLAVFGATFYERTSGFIIRCLYYLLCIAFPLAFFGSFPNVALHLWLPICSCLGIFVGIALRDCCAHTNIRVRQCTRRVLLEWLCAREPLLPVHHPQMELCLHAHDGHHDSLQQIAIHGVSKALDQPESSTDMNDCRSIDS